MGVFKWLRRERLTVTTRHVSPEPSTPEEQNSQTATNVGTIRTEEYKRDLAEFQARRSLGARELDQTPVKNKKCGRHSLPVSCTDCSVDHDNTFSYEKKSAVKYKKKSHRRTKSSMSEEKVCDGVPNIQFLFQNQVFMPGNMVPNASYTEPSKSKAYYRQKCYNKASDSDFIVQRHIDFKEEDYLVSPEFDKRCSLPFDVKNFLNGSRSDGEEEIDGPKEGGDVKVASHNMSITLSSKNDSGEDKLWEVMSELKNFDRWADEQLLRTKSPAASKSDDTKSETSMYGLPIASASNIDVSGEKGSVWSHGKWGVVPVQVKRLPSVTMDIVRKNLNTEINILRKCRHPNVILLMGLYPDIHDNVNIVCERCVDSLYGILHVQGRILTAQMSVRYALDVANALVFLRMQGYVHGALTSEGVMVTANDTAKLADLGPCTRLPKDQPSPDKSYTLYSPEPEYVNIEDTGQTNPTGDCEPLLSHRSSESYIRKEAVAKSYDDVKSSLSFRWQSPELFQPDENGLVHICSKADVYSLTLILWECCNASLPWKSYTYEKLKESYVMWKTGIRLRHDGTYPGCLLSLLQGGLKLNRRERLDLVSMQDTLQNVKRQIEDLEYIIIPTNLGTKKSEFSIIWDTSPSVSECFSPVSTQERRHNAVVHKERESSTESEKDCSDSPLYEVITKIPDATYAVPEKCFISDEDQHDDRPLSKYQHLQDKDMSSACSTPLAKVKARYKDIGTPGALQRSDSTEYCSIFSPNRTVNFGLKDNGNKECETEKPTAKLSRSFTPKSYKPLHIKVPEFHLSTIKPILKGSNECERSSYNFDIKNYSLPTTPIARSNKLRKNAWLSGDLSMTKKSVENLDKTNDDQKEGEQSMPSPLTTASVNTSSEKQNLTENPNKTQNATKTISSVCAETQDSFSTLRSKVDQPSYVSSPDTEELVRERSNSWSFKTVDRNKYKVEEDVLSNINVKPLVAIHERWIYEANKKTGRSMSLPEDNKNTMPAFKPASHCVDTLQKSLPQLNLKKTSKFRSPGSPNLGRNVNVAGAQWEQFCQARESVARGLNFASKDTDRFHTWKKDSDKGTVIEENPSKCELKIDQATDTRSIEEFIRELIRKEFQHLLHEISHDVLTNISSSKSAEISKGIANIVENLKTHDDETSKKESIKSLSKVKINGHNKPLFQITFARSGENSLQVLDNCVNVTICDSNSGKEKANQPDETAIPEEGQFNSLKRCQAFSAIQEARSTEDLYIDDDISTQMQENFGGKVKLIPLHGSLHEILCEREDECCLIKVKQENGCDTIYFRCDNSDTESRDAIDGNERTQDTVVFKRSISLVEERVQRIYPKEKRAHTPLLIRRPKPKIEIKTRPKSEVFVQNISEMRVLSNSSPSLSTKDNGDEVEVNIESVLCYQDSSSDECLKCQAEDDFELLEKKIEEDIANASLSSMTCGCLEKISEENLSVINEEISDEQ